MTTLGNYYVSKTFGRFDELHVHRPHCSRVLLDHRIDGASALSDVATQTSNEPQVVRRIDEDLDVHLFEQARLGKDKDSLHDHDWLRLDARGRGQTRVGPKIINRQLDRF